MTLRPDLQWVRLPGQEPDRPPRPEARQHRIRKKRLRPIESKQKKHFPF